MVTAASPVVQIEPMTSVDQQRRDQPARADADDEAERDQHEGKAAGVDRAGERVVQLLLPKHRLAGHAHLDVGILLAATSAIAASSAVERIRGAVDRAVVEDRLDLRRAGACLARPSRLRTPRATAFRPTSPRASSSIVLARSLSMPAVDGGAALSSTPVSTSPMKPARPRRLGSFAIAVSRPPRLPHLIADLGNLLGIVGTAGRSGRSRATSRRPRRVRRIAAAP